MNCLSGVCKMGGIPSDDNFPDQSQGNQWWRFLLPLIFHMGIIHLLIIVMIQLYIGIKIERTAGWLRVGLIYIISGIGGNLVCELSPVFMWVFVVMSVVKEVLESDNLKLFCVRMSCLSLLLITCICVRPIAF